MRSHSNNEGTVAKCKFLSVCPFGLIEFYCEDIIDCKLCDIAIETALYKNLHLIFSDLLKVKVKVTE